MAGRRSVTLITDFGTTGPYVGAMKGALLRVNPDINIIDITHDIRRGDILEAAFVLHCAFSTFPEGSIHVVVVDPTVGSERKPLLVSTENHYFIGPDNGVFSYIFARDDIYSVVEITEDHFFHKPTSATFHGRDIFAPVAAWLSKIGDTSRFGPVVESYRRMEIPVPNEVKAKAWRGTVLYVDRFGNLITNFTEKQIPLDERGYPAVSRVLTIRGEIKKFCRYFSESTDQEPFLIFGSSGYYEIAVNGGSAAEALGLQPGGEVGIIVR